MSKKNLPSQEMSYEQAFAELEEIVGQLEGEQPPLEEALKLYERGQALSRRCADLLDKAELKLRQLGGDELQDLMEDEALS